MANNVISRTADLDHEGKTEFLSGTLFADEDQAHTFSIGATQNKTDIALSGVVTANFIRPDGGTIPLTGTIENGRACVTLLAACYVQPGRFKLTIFVTDNGVKVAVYCVAGTIAKTTTNVIIDPGQVVPSVNDIIAEYGTMQQAVEDCDTAKDNANTAAAAADAAAASVPEAIAEYSETLQDVSDNQIIVETEAAAFAYIPDAARAAAKGVDITIKPVQAGSGDPSSTNIRAISGWTAVKLGRASKNMLPKMTAGTYTYRGVTAVVDANGVATFSGTSDNAGNFQMIIPLDGSFTIPHQGLVYQLRNSIADGNFVPTIEGTTGSRPNLDHSCAPANRTATLADNRIGTVCSQIRFYTTKNHTVNLTYAPSLMITAGDYEPNDGENSLQTIALPEEAGTVYGGTLHINEDGSGVLTVTHGYIASYAGETLPGEWISDRDVYAEGTTPATGAQVVYELATSTTYALTAEEVQLLKGANTIYADAGDTAVEYVADTKAYIDNKIAELQALILENI